MGRKVLRVRGIDRGSVRPDQDRTGVRETQRRERREKRLSAGPEEDSSDSQALLGKVVWSDFSSPGQLHHASRTDVGLEGHLADGGTTREDVARSVGVAAQV